MLLPSPIFGIQREWTLHASRARRRLEGRWTLIVKLALVRKDKRPALGRWSWSHKQYLSPPEVTSSYWVAAKAPAFFTCAFQPSCRKENRSKRSTLGPPPSQLPFSLYLSVWTTFNKEAVGGEGWYSDSPFLYLPWYPHSGEIHGDSNRVTTVRSMKQFYCKDLRHIKKKKRPNLISKNFICSSLKSL